MVHWIDVAHWFLELDHPDTAVSIGMHVQSQGVWETPDTVQTLLQYTNPAVQAYFEGTFYNARHGAMIEFMGSEATLYIDRGRYEIQPERKKKVAYRELVLSKEPDFRGADFYDQPDGETLHLANWIECIRSRRRPNAPAEAGVSAAAAAHLANLALRQAQLARWSEAIGR
jgi:predicted dehydrogenase